MKTPTARRRPKPTSASGSAGSAVRTPARPSGARHQRRRRLGLPLGLAVVVGLGGGLLMAAPLSRLISESADGAPAGLANPFASWTSFGREDVLLLGTDVGGGNTDVIAAVRLDGGVTRVIQVPRDSYIETEAYGPIKINALQSLGGTDAVKQELSQRLGRPIGHHVVVNLRALRRIADLVGGVEVDVPKRMAYTDNSQGLHIDLQPGRQTLRGHDLEGFLRFRHDEMGDIGRLERQQLALQALFRKITRPDQLVRLPSLLISLGEDVRTDMGPMELGGLLTLMGTTQLQTQRLAGRPFDQGGVSYWETDWPAHAGTETGTAPSESENTTASSGKAPESRYRFLF
jgi:LCP family protein required for cell wall assembly